jgi:hypothetical protein
MPRSKTKPNKAARKQLKREYQREPRSFGVFLIRNVASDKVFLAAGLDLRRTMNRHKFQLTRGIHANAQLQADWIKLGAANFAFEILEENTPSQSSQSEQLNELTFTEDLWLERLKPFGERGYNQPKLSKDQKLKRIAANRRGSES